MWAEGTTPRAFGRAVGGGPGEGKTLTAALAARAGSAEEQRSQASGFPAERRNSEIQHTDYSADKAVMSKADLLGSFSNGQPRIDIASFYPAEGRIERSVDAKVKG